MNYKTLLKRIILTVSSMIDLKFGLLKTLRIYYTELSDNISMMDSLNVYVYFTAHFKETYFLWWVKFNPNTLFKNINLFSLLLHTSGFHSICYLFPFLHI